MDELDSSCGDATFEDLDRRVYDFAQVVREAIFAAIDACGKDHFEDGDDRSIVQLWSAVLGALTWDVSGSVLLELSHGRRRAPVILNRCVFEYGVRLRYYAKKPDKAREALAQMHERFKTIMRADQSWRLENARNVPATDHRLRAVKIIQQYETGHSGQLGFLVPAETDARIFPVPLSSLVAFASV
jgi:hypothetical protein